MQVYMETERLLLRRFTPDDVDNLVDLDADPEVMRYLNGGTPTPRATIEADTLPRFLQSYEMSPGMGAWAAVEKATGDFLGWISLRPVRVAVPGEAELGYRLRRAAWGKGYATEGARALIRTAFEQSDLRRVVATTYQDNIASRRVMEKLGMRLVRSYRLTPADLTAQDTYQVTSLVPWDGDDVEYAIEKAEWQRQHATFGRVERDGVNSPPRSADTSSRTSSAGA